MLFNSLDFAWFFPTVFILYWFVFNRNIQQQNTLIALASYVFYGWWDWRFLFLISFSALVDFLVGLALATQQNPKKRKLLLFSSLFTNLSLLAVFKYYNFFLDNIENTFSFLGNSITIERLDIILPVGISFYTFQTLSYSIDCYQRKLEPTRNFITFTAFVSFFPQLVAGPIERATHLLPQFFKQRTFNQSQAIDACRRILWGLFKKIAIADVCAGHVNTIFSNYQEYQSGTLLLGAILFAFQIYGDFSGYSDIAIGTAKLFGFNLSQNFRFPYFSRDMAEFWRRWHISLSTWFRDYVYIPLGGSRTSRPKQIRNTLIVFTLSGFWHGANWTFIFWGLLNALYFIPLLLQNKNRNFQNTPAEHNIFPTFKELIQITCTFFLTTFAWIFFRAENINQALNYIQLILNPTHWSLPEIWPRYLIITLIAFIIIEWKGRKSDNPVTTLVQQKHYLFRHFIYAILCAYIFWNKGNQSEFIYFQF